MADYSSFPPVPVPAGWYADPEKGGALRWWDGARWTEQVQEPFSVAPAVGDARAPEGTSTSTVWIWLLGALHFAGAVRLMTIDLEQYLRASLASNPTTEDSTLLLASSAIGWLIYGLAVLFARRDHRELTARRVPRPFHWAWGFLAPLVYVIGRTVVVRRRADGLTGPLWLAIAGIVTTMIAAGFFVVAATELIMELAPVTLR